MAQPIADRLGQFGAAAEAVQLRLQPGFKLGDQRGTLRLTNGQAVFRRAAADASLDGVERCDTQQGLAGNGGLRGGMDVEKAPAQMRPAEGQHHRAIVTAALQRLKAVIAIHLQHTAKAGEMRHRMLGAAVFGIDMGHRWRAAAQPGPVIHGISPEPASAGSAAPALRYRCAGRVPQGARI